MTTPVDDEELALDVIDAVGPGGHYLGHAHTRKHMRAGFVRGLGSEPDAQGGYRDAVEVARERALDILENYQFPSRSTPTRPPNWRASSRRRTRN